MKILKSLDECVDKHVLSVFQDFEHIAIKFTDNSIMVIANSESVCISDMWKYSAPDNENAELLLFAGLIDQSHVDAIKSEYTKTQRSRDLSRLKSLLEQYPDYATSLSTNTPQ